MKPTTICANCRHFIKQGNIWYDQYCGHPDLIKPRCVDPVTGKEGYGNTNDLGMPYIDDAPFPYARDINNGDCSYFEGGDMPTDINAAAGVIVRLAKRGIKK